MKFEILHKQTSTNQLLALNHERYEEQVRQGLHAKRKSGSRRKHRERRTGSSGGSGSLFGEQAS